MSAASSEGARKRAQHLRQVVSQNVKARRKALGLTFVEAAERCGLHWRHYQKIEADALNITLATLACLSISLDIDECELMREREPEDKGAPPMRAEQSKGKVRKSMRVRKSEAIAIRIDKKTHRRLCSLRPHLSDRARDATISDVCRKLLMVGLHAVDEEGPDILLNVTDRPESEAVGSDSEEAI